MCCYSITSGALYICVIGIIIHSHFFRIFLFYFFLFQMILNIGDTMLKKNQFGPISFLIKC